MPVRSLRLGVLTALLAWSGAASAKPRLELSWTAPEYCPTESQVLQRARRMLRGSEADVSVSATARVSRVGERFIVKLQTHGDTGDGQRTLSAESCDAAASATALMLALAVDPNARLGEPGEAPDGQPGGVDTAKPRGNGPQPARLPQKSKSPETARSGENVSANSDRVRGASKPAPVTARILVGGEASWGVLPKLTLAPSLGLGLGVGRLAFDLQGAYFPGSSATLSDGRRGGDFSRWALSLRGFYGLGSQRFQLGPAARIIATRIHGTGSNVSRPSSADAWIAALAFGPRLEWHLGGLAFALSAESGLPFTRPSFALDELGTLHTPARVLFAAALEVLLVF
ncbi:MAG: hypothetical protein AB7K71_26555 [Polyangiaceae bacterium]